MGRRLVQCNKAERAAERPCPEAGVVPALDPGVVHLCSLPEGHREACRCRCTKFWDNRGEA